MQRQLGRKTTTDDTAFTESDASDSESSEVGSDSEEKEEKRKRTALKQMKEDFNDIDFLDPEKLTGVQKRKKDKHTRLQSILKGREGRDKFGSKKNMKTRAGGTTNKEKQRNKPQLMVQKGRRIARKNTNLKGSQKQQNLRNH